VLYDVVYQGVGGAKVTMSTHDCAKLLKRRLSLGLTQQLLAERLEVTRNKVARWERDEMAIPRRLLDLALKTIEPEKPRKRLPKKSKA
jgi:DNA-binding transcriptional regulator YiaG